MIKEKKSRDGGNLGALWEYSYLARACLVLASQAKT
jgi:hypothetical protein